MSKRDRIEEALRGHIRSWTVPQMAREADAAEAYVWRVFGQLCDAKKVQRRKQWNGQTSSFVYWWVSEAHAKAMEITY